MANTLTGLVTPLTDSAYFTGSDLTTVLSIVSPLNDQVNPQSSPLISQLMQQGSAAMDFSGIGAQAFQESMRVHTDVTGQIVQAFQSTSQALTTFGNAVTSANTQYDGQLSTIKGSDYGPGYPWDNVTAEACTIFANLNPSPAMIDDVIASADGNAVLQSGDANLQGLLSDAYVRLYNRVYSMPISIAPVGGSTANTPPTPGQIAAQKAQAQQMVVDALLALYTAISQVYNSWGNAVQQGFQTFQTSMNTVEQTVKPYTDLLTDPTSAASIFDMIHMISGSNEPIAITQVGPNRILVTISGTNMSNMSYDTDIWNALGTGMLQNMPYEQDVIDAIQQYCQEHNLTNPDVVLAGHSLGGMVAQQVAEKGIFNVTQVVTYGSPVMGDPVPGIQYDIYEAQADAVPLLSRYENPTLPDSLPTMAHMFPNFQTNYEGFKNPFSWSGFTHDLGAAGRDIGATWDNVFSGAKNLAGAGYLYGEISGAAGVVPLGFKNIPAGPIINGINGNALGDVTEFTPGAKVAYMDPHGLYGNSIKPVLDLDPINITVHSDYGKSAWLENQHIYQNMPSSGFLSNTEYFGMPNEYQTAQIDQYMQAHSSIGQLLK